MEERPIFAQSELRLQRFRFSEAFNRTGLPREGGVVDICSELLRRGAHESLTALTALTAGDVSWPIGMQNPASSVGFCT